MTYNEDPTRWTSSPDDAPELLRGAFAAGRDEGPSRGQMRSLALKIAAASAGGAVAVGTVKAASAGQAVATAATWSVGKVATAVALAGTLVTGGALVWRSGTERPEREVAGSARVNANGTAAPEAAESESALGTSAQARGGTSAQARGAARAPEISAQRADGPVVEPLVARGVSAQEHATPEGAVHAGEASRGAQHAAAAGASKGGNDSALDKTRGAASEKHKLAAGSASSAARVERAKATARPSATLSKSSKPTAPPSEIELLHRAQIALQARPREAFQLTQEHRRFYPEGEFAQERDALAIQALLRVGDTEKARDLAASFIRAYPSSPHAHRFREAMGLR
jgi:hypothetical protein